MKAVDLIELAKSLPGRRRGKACIVLAKDYAGQKEWADKLANLSGSAHCNILDDFINSDGSMKLSSFTVDGLFNYLENQAPTKLLVISGVEFIKATWAHNPQKAMDELASKIEFWSKDPALMFVMQYDPLIAKMNFSRFKDLKFVVDQQNTIAL